MLNRCKFVASTALLAGSPLILPSLASARSASDRITLGFIGVGKQSLGHLNRFLSNQDVEVVAVCDVVQDRIGKAIATVHEKYAERSEQAPVARTATGMASVVNGRESIGPSFTQTLRIGIANDFISWSENKTM